MDEDSKILEVFDTDDFIILNLTKSEFNWCYNWIQCFDYSKVERLSDIWFLSLNMFLKNKYLDNIYNISLEDSFKMEIKLPRKFLRVFVFIIGKQAYDFDFKTKGPILAYNIITKIEGQLKNDEDWQNFRF